MSLKTLCDPQRNSTYKVQAISIVLLGPILKSLLSFFSVPTQKSKQNKI